MFVEKHGLSKHPVYHAWKKIRQAVYNPKCKNYSFCGARGITIYPPWEDSSNFLEDMLPTWKPGLVLHRKDWDGPYAPDNCIWVTRIEANRENRRIKLDMKEARNIQTLKSLGLSYNEIGWIYDLPKSTVANVVKNHWK